MICVSLSTTKVGCAGRVGAVAVGAGVWVTVGSGTANDHETFPASTAWSVAGGSSVRVKVALRSVRPRTWLAKAMTSAELAGTHSYVSVITALAIITSSISPSLAVTMIRPVASNSGVNRSLGEVVRPTLTVP